MAIIRRLEDVANDRFGYRYKWSRGMVEKVSGYMVFLLRQLIME